MPTPLQPVSQPDTSAPPPPVSPDPITDLAEQRLSTVLDVLGQGESDVARVVDDLVVNTLARINEHYAAVGLVLDQLIGAVDNATQKPLMDVMRVGDRVAEKVLMAIRTHESDVYGTGIQIPPTIEDRQAQMADDSHAWLPLVLPGLAELLADPPPDPGQVATTESTACPPGWFWDGNKCVPGLPPAPGPPVAPPPPPPPPGPPPPPPPPANCCDTTRGQDFSVIPACFGTLRPEANEYQLTAGTLPGDWLLKVWTVDCVNDAVWLLSPPIPPSPDVQWTQQTIGLQNASQQGPPFCVERTRLAKCSGVGVPPPPPPPPSPPSPPIGTECCPPQEITVSVPPIVFPPPPPPTECKQPEEPPKAKPTAAPKLLDTGVNWCADDVCGQITAAISKAAPVDPVPSGPAEAEVGTLGKAYRELVANGQALIDWVTSGFNTRVEAASYEAHGRAVGEYFTGFSSALSIINSGSLLGVPDTKTAWNLGTKLALAGRAEAQTNFPATYLVTSELYCFQFANPQYIPSQAEIDRTYLADVLTSDQWECLTRALGNRPDCRKLVLEADRVRPGVTEIIQLWRRGWFSDEEANKKLRAVGVLHGDEQAEFAELSRFIPPYSDLIRMMVRDSADDQVASQYGYDQGFSTKFGPKIQEWARAQGIDAGVFQYLWRAHWQIPSYTQLTEMHFRFPEDRPEVVQWDAVAAVSGAAVATAKLGPRPLVVTVQDVQTALEVNDMAPNWINPLIGIAYKPLTRIDATRAYEIGAIGKDDLYWSFRRLGYDDTNSNTLVRFFDLKKARTVASTTDTWSIRKTKQIYKAGGINRADALAHLAKVTTNPTQAAEVLDGADQELQAEAQEHQIAAIRKAYLFGELGQPDVIARFTALGLAGSQQQWFLVRWDADRMGRLKEPTIRELGRWYRRGAINGDQFRDRLLRLGYTQADTARIIYSANVEELEREQAKFEKLMREVRQRIKDQQAAKAAAEKDLKDLLKKDEQEVTRIKKELNRRAAEQGLPPPYPDV